MANKRNHLRLVTSTTTRLGDITPINKFKMLEEYGITKEVLDKDPDLVAGLTRAIIKDGSSTTPNALTNIKGFIIGNKDKIYN